MALERADLFAFAPYNGGEGVRIASVTTSASAPVAIPGVGTAPVVRLLVTNGGLVSAFIRFGRNESATLNSLEVLPGTQIVLSVPASLSGGGLTVSAITASGTTTISVVAGDGT